MLTTLGEARELKLPMILDNIKIVSAPAQSTVFDLYATFENIVATTYSSTMIVSISSRAIHRSVRNLRVETAAVGKLDALAKRTNGHAEDQKALLAFPLCEELRAGMNLTL